MRRLLLLLVVISIFSFGCRRDPVQNRASLPDPPFAGDLPADAYRYDGPPGVYGGTLVLGKTGDLKTFNLITATDASTAEVLSTHVYRSLVDYRQGGNPPDFDSGLCTKWETNPEGTLWTFFLRRGISWSDGSPFTADDVIFSYKLVTDSRVASPIRDSFAETASSGVPVFPTIEKTDEHTVQFTLSKPNGDFLDAVYSLWLVPKHRWEESLRAGTFSEAMPLSSNPADVVVLGPYRIREYATGERIVLERNPYFWKVDRQGQRLPYLDQIIFVIARDFNTVLAKFQAGEIDVMPRVRGEDYQTVKALEGQGIKVEEIGISLDVVWLTLNQNTGSAKSGKPLVAPWKLRLFRDQRFRQALSYAIDREGMANTVYYGRAVPVYSFVTPGNAYWYSDGIVKYAFDPDRARTLLAELKLSDQNGDGILEDSEGHQISLSITTNTESAQRVGAANAIAKNLEAVGIKCSVDSRPINSVLDTMQSSHEFEGLLLSWQTGVPPGPTTSKNILLSSGLQHAWFPQQTSPSTEWETEIDRLLHKTVSSTDSAERRKLYADVQRIWSEQLPEIDLVAQREAVAYKNHIRNIAASPLPPRVTWNIEEIFFGDI